MAGNLTRFSQSALGVGIITCVLSAGVSVYSAYLSYSFQSATQDRQIQLDRVQKFDSNADITEALNAFLIDVNRAAQTPNKPVDLTKVKEKFRQALFAQMQEAESIGRLFEGREARQIVDFQNAVIAFNKETQTFSDVKDIGQWAENLGKIIDMKATLVKKLNDDLKPKKAAAL